MKRPLALLAAATLAATIFTVTPTASVAPADAATKYVSAKTLLKKLPVRAESHSHKYKRAQFKYPLDADHDRCNTRKEVLIQEHIGKIRISKSCAVYGKWKSFFDNKTTTKASALEVDHLVPLAEAWYSGAYKWSSQKKVAFGNDLGYKWSLNAVTKRANRSKGAGDPADWMPAKNKCTYAEAWVAVKSRWGLSVDKREKAKLVSLLSHCGSAKVLKPGNPNLAALSGTKKVSKPSPPPGSTDVVACPAGTLYGAPLTWSAVEHPTGFADVASDYDDVTVTGYVQNDSEAPIAVYKTGPRVIWYDASGNEVDWHYATLDISDASLNEASQYVLQPGAWVTWTATSFTSKDEVARVSSIVGSPISGFVASWNDPGFDVACPSPLEPFDQRTFFPVV